MATGYSSIPSQLCHGGCGGDEGRLTHSPPRPRTLRGGELHGSPRHAVHDTGDDGQSDGQAAVLQQRVEDDVEDDADIGMERGLAAVSWRADVTEFFFDRLVTRNWKFLTSQFLHTDRG